MNSGDLFSIATYSFFSLTLLQGTIELMLLSMGMHFSLLLLSALKYAVLSCMALLLLTTRTVYQIKNTEKLALVLSLAIMVLAAAKGGGVTYIADELRFYLAPIAFFFLGRIVAPFKNDKAMAAFIMTLGVLYATLGILYLFIDRQVLLDGGLRSLFTQKLSDIGRSDAVYNGLPTNFYYFHNDGHVTNRAFGALFDPLVSAFFGAPLFFHLWELHKRKVAAGAGLLAGAVAGLILLSLTRAIIVGIALVLVTSLMHKKGIAALPPWLMLLGALGAGAFVATHLGTLLDPLDPSSQAHLKAYLQFDLKSGLLGSRFDEGTPRGAESLYLTIFLECGVGGIVLFLAWFAQLYRRLRRDIALPYIRASLESMFVYLLASLTTEHWFIFTTGSLFWFLLGNNLTVAEKFSQKTILQARYANLSPEQLAMRPASTQ